MKKRLMYNLGLTPTRPLKTGFTIIEVSLFLAISGFLIIGLIVGTSATIARQRYTDSVQDFAEFLRREYAGVVYTENSINGLTKCNGDGTISVDEDATSESGGYTDTGRANCLIYGRLLVFGEEIGGKVDPNAVSIYTVFGKDLRSRQPDGSIIHIPEDTLTALKVANISASPTIAADSYKLQWGAKAEKTADKSSRSLSYLIVRSPESGIVHSFVLNRALAITGGTDHISDHLMETSPGVPPASSLFAYDTITICVGSDDIFAVGDERRAVRLKSDGHNSSAVELLVQDPEVRVCL
jgi:hypothetical protein